MVASAEQKGTNAYVMDASAMNTEVLLNELSSSAMAEHAPVQDAEEISHRNRQHDISTNLYDAVFSNAALHWMKPPRAVIAGARSVLRPGGRFVGELGGHVNIAAVRSALHAVLRSEGVDPLLVDPLFFPTPKQYQCMLEEAGFCVDEVMLIPRPTPLPLETGIHGWLKTFSKSFQSALVTSDTVSLGTDSSTSMNLFVDEVIDIIRPALQDSEDRWTVYYIRLRFRVHLPE
ncbi:unnamed protein product [Choristocarpus tenellus]